MAYKNPEDAKAYLRKWQQKNRAKCVAYVQKWRAENIEKARLMSKKWRENNRERFSEMKRKWREANPEKVRAQKQRNRKRSAEKIRMRNLRYRAQNRDRIRGYVKKHYRKNIGLSRIRARVSRGKRRARERGGKLRRDIVDHLLTSQRHTCVYCPADLRQSGYHLEHKTPLCRGGVHEDANMQLTCPACNLRKFTRTHEEFLALLKSA